MSRDDRMISARKRVSSRFWIGLAQLSGDQRVEERTTAGVDFFSAGEEN